MVSYFNYKSEQKMTPKPHSLAYGHVS